MKTPPPPPAQDPQPSSANTGNIIYLNAAVWKKSQDSTYQCDFLNIFSGRDMAGRNVYVYHTVSNSVDIPISGNGLYIYQGRLWAMNTETDLHVFFKPAGNGLPFLGLKIKVVIE